MTPAVIADTHCHLDYLQRQAAEDNVPDCDPAAALARASAEGVAFVVNPAVSPKQYDAVMAIAEAHQNVYAAIAIHPTDVVDTLEIPDWQARVEALLTHPKVVAIGETGLDYYWSLEHVALQQRCLRTFLALGLQYDKPVILHDRNVKDPEATPDRDSHRDILSIVSEYPGVRGIMHCFSGDAEFALAMIERGFLISFAGNLTYKNAVNLHEAAIRVPLAQMLVETDTPFLSPMPFRGKMNEPARVRLVVEKIAALKNLPYDEVARVTTENARRVFGIAGASS